MNVSYEWIAVLSFCFLSVCSFAVQAKPVWQKWQTVEDLLQDHPEYGREILEQLDLERPELAAVKRAYQQEEIAQACEALLSYYEQVQPLPSLMLRGDKLPHVDERELVEQADHILGDVYYGFGERGLVPRTEGGHLDWSHTGPKQDKQFRLRLNRHVHLATLFDAWRHTGDDRYLQRIDQDVRDYLIASRGQACPEAFQTSHLEPANRLRPWVWLFFENSKDRPLTRVTRLLMLRAIPLHAEYLLANPGHLNWVTMTQLGAMICGTAWPQFKEAPRWREEAMRAIEQNAEETVYPDGVQNELTSSYHCVSLNRYQIAMEMAHEAGYRFSHDFEKLLPKMWEYVAMSTRPSGTLPLNNDSDLTHALRHPLAGVDGVAARFGRPDWLFAATMGQQGERPADPPSRLFPWAGQLISRSDWDSAGNWSFFDFGPLGASHFHFDHGHLSVAVNGRDVLVDSGRFAYQGQMAEKFRRPYAVHTRGHNTIMIDGKGQAGGPRTVNQPIGMAVVEPSYDFALGTYADGYEDQADNEPSPSHTRAVVYLRGLGWIVFDQVKVQGEALVQPLWHYHPHCEVAFEGSQVVTLDEDQGNLRIAPAGPTQWQTQLVKGQEEPELQGWYSREYGVYEPASCAIYQTQVKGYGKWAWVLTPGVGKPESPRVDWLEAPDHVIRLRVAWQGAKPVTVTAVMDERALPVTLDHGVEMTTARLLIEQEGEAPRAAGGQVAGMTTTAPEK